VLRAQIDLSHMTVSGIGLFGDRRHAFLASAEIHRMAKTRGTSEMTLRRAKDKQESKSDAHGMSV
jgi:hypothetical protein